MMNSMLLYPGLVTLAAAEASPVGYLIPGTLAIVGAGGLIQAGKLNPIAALLAVWFGVHVIFPPTGNVDWFALVVCAVVFFGMLRWKWNIVPVVLGSGLIGLIYALAGFR